MHTIKRVAVLFLILLAVCLSCSRMRRTIIPEKKFIEVLVDLQIADGIGVESMNRREGFMLDSATLYTSVFEKHGVTRAMFDSTMTWYTLHNEAFVGVYNAVITKLKKMETELSDSTRSDTAGPPPRLPFTP
jgi:hypothetical protein